MFQELISKANEALNSKPLVAIDCALEIISQAKIKNTSISSLQLLELFCKATLKSAEIFEKDWNGDIVSSLFINKFSSSQKHFIAASLIRLINANNEFLKIDSSLRPQCFKLFDEIFSRDLYKSLSIDIKMQSHDKESRLLEEVSKFHKDFLGLIDFFKNFQHFPDIRHRFFQTINSRLSTSLLHPFLPKELVGLRTQEIFTIIEKYLDGQGLSKIHIFNEAIKNIDDYLLIAETHGTKYSLDYLGGLARKIKSILQKDFHNSPLSQPASLEIYTNEKKYPFSRLNHKFNLNLVIKNNASGQAFDVNLNLIEVSDNIQLDKRELYLGHIEITTIELEIPCEVIYPNQKAELLGELIWTNFDNSKGKEEFELELEGQNSDIDWEKLVIEEPYSLEPVETEDELVGRKDVLDQLIRSASAKNSVGSSYILGQKRVGKTSIAKTLGSRLSKLNTSDYLVIYIEGGEYSYPSATETIRNLGQRICKKIQKAEIKLSHLQTPEFKNSLSPLSDFLEEVINIIPEYRILFILDEFDELPIDTYKFTPIGQSFFLTLRAISSQKNFGFVLVGGEKMEFIISVQGDALNKFQPNRIDYFEKFLSDFQDLVRKPVAKWGIEISDLALYELHQQTGGNPYFTKQICRELFKLMVARRDGHITLKEIKEATTFTLNTIASNSFIHFWKDGIFETGDIAEQNSMNRRKILLALAETYRKCSEVKKEHIIDQAIKYGLKTDIIEKELRDFERRQVLINTNDIYDCKVPLFAKWLRDKGVNEIITTFTDPDAILKRKKDEEEAYVRPEEILKLVNTWELYRGQAITDDKVRAWLNQFGENSKQRLMFKILQKVRFYQEHPIRIKMKQCERIVNQGLVRKYVEGQKKRSDILISSEVLNVKKNPIKIAQNMVILGEGLKYISLIVIINSFPKIVKDILRKLPKNDYPVLNSRLFFECWLSYALDNSLTSMRDLFKRLNNTGFEVDISTFSKANLHRSQKQFQEIYQNLNELVQKKVSKKLHDKYAICPIDSTIISLTSKLLWVLGHHQVKLFSSLNLSTGSPEDNFINFGHDHDYKFGSKMMSNLPINAVGVMDRGFAGLNFIQELVQENKYFVLRIKNNWKLKFEDASGLVKVGASDEAIAYRVINFCDLETKTEFRLVTNLPSSGDASVSDDEIKDIYRLRWGVELLWKFLKMHLKLDKLITKNVNGITIQIYVSLIAYLILQLLSIPRQWGHTLLDKFRYLQSCMCQKISYVHWFEEMMLC